MAPVSIRIGAADARLSNNSLSVRVHRPILIAQFSSNGSHRTVPRSKQITSKPNNTGEFAPVRFEARPLLLADDGEKPVSPMFPRPVATRSGLAYAVSKRIPPVDLFSKWSENSLMGDVHPIVRRIANNHNWVFGWHTEENRLCRTRIVAIF
jgi:hypothetical protein